MTRWHRQRPEPVFAKLSRMVLAAAVVSCLLSVSARSCLASDVLLLKQDDSKILQFRKMKRVWVQDPEIIDVVVTSYNELLVYSKSVGRTRLYVWDAVGRHEYAVQVRGLPTVEQLIRELSSILGRALSYTIVDDKTIMVEGEVKSEAEKDRVTKVIAAKRNGIEVLDLVIVPQATLTVAEEHRRAFEKLFPEQFRYSTIDESTLVIEGEVGTADEKDRMEKILAAAKSITVVDLVQCLEGRLTPEEQRIASIKQAVGEAYEYLVLEDSILVISGEADCDTEKERIDKIIVAAAGDITVVNVVSVKTDTRPAPVKYAELLKPVFGAQYTFTPLGETGLVVEGLAPTAADEARIEQILELVEDVRIVNLVSTGPLTPGERALAMLQESLGEGYQVRIVTDDVVVVDGTAETTADKEHADTVIAAAPEGAKVINLVEVRVPNVEAWESTKYQQALPLVLGDGLTYRALDESMLLIEGEVACAGDRERIQKILEALGGPTKFLELITVRPGPDAMAASPASRKAEALVQVIGTKYTCTPLDENTVVVQGVAPGEDEQQRLAAIIDQLAGEITVVNMIVSDERIGTTTPAERAIEGLRPVVPQNLKLVVIDDKTVLIEGIVPTSIEKERMDKIANMTTASASVNVLSLVLAEMESKTPAARRIEGLKRILGDQYNYVVWDEETVLVEGTVESQQELERVRKILEAADQDFKVGDLVTYAAPGAGQALPEGAPDPMAELIERISGAIGEPYRVWHLKQQKFVVEGAAPDEAAMGRLTQLLAAYADEAEIINLVTVAPEPTVPLVARAESLRSVLGDDYQVKTLQGKAIVVEAVVRTKEEAARAAAIIEAMAIDVPVVDLVIVADPAKRQILAHVKVLDINRGQMKKLGVNWGQLAVGSQAGTVTFADQPFLFKIQGGVDAVSDLAANMDIMKQSDWARILAEPNLVVNEGEEAEIVVGGEVPIPVPTDMGGIAIEYKEYGVVLRLKPEIMQDGKTIRLSIEPEVSSIDPATRVSIGGIPVPAFRTRKASTVVDMPDGATLVIGGLLHHEQSKVVRRIPLLSKLPIIGSLFKSTDWQHGLTELVILVTPEILQTTQP